MSKQAEEDRLWYGDMASSIKTAAEDMRAAVYAENDDDLRIGVNNIAAQADAIARQIEHRYDKATA